MFVDTTYGLPGGQRLYFGRQIVFWSTVALNRQKAESRLNKNIFSQHRISWNVMSNVTLKYAYIFTLLRKNLKPSRYLV